MSAPPVFGEIETQIRRIQIASDQADARGQVAKDARLRRDALSLQATLRETHEQDIRSTAKSEGLTVEGWKRKHDPDPRMVWGGR